LDTADPPFPAAKIREGCPAGRWSKYRIEAPGEPTVITMTEFTNVDENGALYRVTTFDEEENALGEPKTRKATWKEFESHATYPEAATKIADGEIEVPAGTFDGLIYTVVEEHEGSTLVTRAEFARDIPGPPAKHTVTRDGDIISKMELLDWGLGE
jgi:hypothetical protein